MKFSFTSLLILIFFVGCGTTQQTLTTAPTNTQIKEQKKLVPSDAILGTWKMESYQVFSPDPDPTDSQEIIWEFKNNREILIGNTEGKTSALNSGRYWMNKSILKVNSTLYMYSFEAPYGLPDNVNAKPLGDELWLDSNIDPSISNDGPKIHFTKVR